MIKKVQKRATQMVSSLRNLPYEERLRALDLPSLYFHRKREDMIPVYQIFHGLIYVNPLTFFSTCFNRCYTWSQFQVPY